MNALDIANIRMNASLAEFAFVLCSILLVGLLGWFITRLSTTENQRLKQIATARLAVAVIDAIAWAVKNLLINWPKTNPLTVQAHPEILIDAEIFLTTYYQTELTILDIDPRHLHQLLVARMPDELIARPPAKEKGDP